MTHTMNASKAGATVTAYVDGVAVASRNSRKATPWASIYWNDGSEYGISLHGSEAAARQAVATATAAGWWSFGEAVEVAR